MKRIFLFTFVVVSFILTMIYIQNFIFSFLLEEEKNENKISKNIKEDFYKNNTSYKITNDLYNLYESKNIKVVMLGDSLTYRVTWSELINESFIVNRGINGDTTKGFLNRLDNIYKLKPKVVFIMGGINDLTFNIKNENIINNVKKIVSSLEYKNIDVVLQAVIYTNNMTLNKKVKKLNILLEKYSKENKLTYIDLNDELSSKMYLKENFSSDGLHLNAKAYNIWAKRIKAYTNIYIKK